jgi:hypothetical membrane protein
LAGTTQGDQAEEQRVLRRARHLKLAGSLITIFTIQFALVMIVAEAIYRPGYSVANKYISDLGVGATGPLFDGSISILGIAVIAAAYFLHSGLGSRALAVLTGLVGVGALLVGVFNESFGVIHAIVSLWTFLAGSITAIYAWRVERAPMRYISAALGAFSLAAIVVSVAVPGSLGLGVGGIERMIVYPFMLWGIAFGGYLLGHAGR